MDYTFIEQCRKIQQDGLQREERLAQEAIIDILLRWKMYGPKKARQVDEYDGEGLFDGTTLLPGQIYIFLYEAKEPVVYERGNEKLTFYDSTPILLVTHVGKGVVSGINLNLCNRAVRAYTINALHNLDLEFYNRKHLVDANSGRAPFSQNVARVFTNRETESAFLKHIVTECKLVQPDVLYRTYNIGRIQQIRMLEVWHHIHIPFLAYHGELKKEILAAIYHLTYQDRLLNI